MVCLELCASKLTVANKRCFLLVEQKWWKVGQVFSRLLVVKFRYNARKMKLNFHEKMGNTWRILVWFLVVLAICWNLECEATLTGDFSVLQSDGIDHSQLDCEYNLNTGDKICDCRNRNKVNITFWHSNF